MDGMHGCNGSWKPTRLFRQLETAQDKWNNTLMRCHSATAMIATSYRHFRRKTHLMESRSLDLFLGRTGVLDSVGDELLAVAFE